MANATNLAERNNEIAKQPLSPSDYSYQREMRRMALAVKFIKIERAAQAQAAA